MIPPFDIFKVVDNYDPAQNKSALDHRYCLRASTAV